MLNYKRKDFYKGASSMDFQKIVGRVLDKYNKFEDNVRYQQEKKLQEYESKVNEYEIKVNSSNNRSLQDIKEAKEKIDKAREAIELQKKGRRTDEEAAKLPTNWNSRNATEADCKYNVKLSDLSAYGNKPGVYIL